MKKRLVQIHNALGEIETKGESTVIMAECVLAIRQIVVELDREERETTEKAEEPENEAE